MIQPFILSIVIPTFRRAACLEILLSSITSHLSYFPTDLEIIVLDNASPDNTENIVSEFANTFPIKYFRHDENIGMDGNIAACFNVASGRYLWVLGDDEILYQGTLNYVLNLCRNREFGILYMENGGFKDGQEGAIALRSIPENIKIKTLNSEKIFREVNVFLTFISANIINREEILRKIPDFDFRSDTGTFLPQMAWMYSALKIIDSHIYIYTPMFGAMTGNTGGYKLIQVFGANLINITKKYFSEDSFNNANIMSNAVVTRLLPGELMHQFGSAASKSNFEHEDINLMIASCFGNNKYANVFLKGILSNSKLRREISFFGVRVLNKINKNLHYALL
ncbi:glycosyltransferase family 2 protein [Janthinobacterium sp. SUN211]|uniref:glycosyltransferase family 2 protein n=1 Tax=Janthinobacterium sp. SUN211 TaxID=3014786 RepID=UPI0027125167|nr:glycosyltransferase family 2 protein [Janthinobacterium sp. SUN211]MDO8052206.1 glycosyltransferase family 2 protein [Janthinobacterium sp. SUN211]